MTQISRRLGVDRRTLLLGAGAAAGVALLPRVGRSAPGPNEKLRVGAIGVGGRASLLLEQLPEGADIVALCDVNVPRAHAFREKKGAAWPVYVDYRRILDRPDIDAVIVGTG